MNPDQAAMDQARRSASLVEHERMLRRQRYAAAMDRARQAQPPETPLLCTRCAKGDHGQTVCCRPWSCCCGCAS